MYRYIHKLADVSLAKVLKALLEPWRVSLALRAPEPLSPSRAIMSLFPTLDAKDVESVRLDLLRKHKLFEDIDRKMVEIRHRRASFEGWREFLYLTVRFLRPRIVVETGVFDGESSAIILQALEDNDRGHLFSIDLPANNTIDGSTEQMFDTTLPPNCLPGWVIPERLKGRHTLLLGDTRDLLPALLEEQANIDLFFHDSLHTFDHQYFEYTAAWPHLVAGGLLLSDDVSWSPAFHRFCRQMATPYVRTGGGRLGAAKKHGVIQHDTLERERRGVPKAVPIARMARFGNGLDSAGAERLRDGTPPRGAIARPGRGSDK